MKTQQADVAVIGAGTAGMAAWRAATQAGAHAVLIEAGAFGTTCAVPTVPREFSVFGERLLTSGDIFKLESLPQRLAVFGAGPLALELAQGLSRLGVEVSVFGRGGEVAGITDKTVREAFSKRLASEFYFDPDAAIHDMSLEDGVPTIDFRGIDGMAQREQFDSILVATGRRPNLEPLMLEHAGISLDAQGTPCFEPASMQCGTSSIFMAGDCDGTRPWLQDAVDEGQLAGENAARFPDVRHIERKVPFSVIFCQPQIALVGASVESSDERAVVTGFVSFEDQGRRRNISAICSHGPYSCG